MRPGKLLPEPLRMARPDPPQPRMPRLKAGPSSWGEAAEDATSGELIRRALWAAAQEEVRLLQAAYDLAVADGVDVGDLVIVMPLRGPRYLALRSDPMTPLVSG
ncbi:hypothetical protein [Dactylosporangium sp. CS-033363]|uniref:hypothetical protein n=1 Tax=Dactylosporangium sp. CS-033363 TaxID=3239935 RepID=UPI003D8A88A7